MCKSKMFHAMQSPKIHSSAFLCVRGKAGYQSMITTFFFDEMYMSSPYILNKMRVFCNENHHLIVRGAGDVKQLLSIEPFTNKQNGEEFVDNCIDIIFKYNIFLQIRKRVGGKDTEEGTE